MSPTIALIVQLTGMLIFIVMHIMPRLSPVRSYFIQKVGLITYRLCFTYLSSQSLLMVATGYYFLNPAPEYRLSDTGSCMGMPLTELIILYVPLHIVAFFAFFASFFRSYFKRYLGCPLALSAIIFGGSHLLISMRCTTAELILFGGFLVFGILEILTYLKVGTVMPLNTQEKAVHQPGKRTPTYQPELRFDILSLVLATAFTVGLTSIHHLFFGGRDLLTLYLL